MMVSYYRDDRIRKSNRRQQVSANVGVTLHFVEFGAGQFSRLVKNVLWDSELSHIMEQRGRLDCLKLAFFPYSKALGKLDSVSLHSSNVAMRDLVFCIHGHSQGLDGRQVKIIDL